jgi:3-deoxy-D-manno-octulosonic-acid transferase
LSGKPVAFGPHIANVAAAAEALLKNGAATLVHDAQELQAEWLRLLMHPEIASAMGASARAVIDASAGVAERTLAIVRACMVEASQ